MEQRDLAAAAARQNVSTESNSSTTTSANIGVQSDYRRVANTSSEYIVAKGVSEHDPGAQPACGAIFDHKRKINE